ncbi:hypothetical protein GCM10023231_24580 [Olivibacter ginsenosidimutans]|uniref:Uncharacterized protein n=2 Tax=Olivibacter ginsenosidimutans TaxID=1176537 RepID=A0ABP9BGQ7_9SPHI
MGLLVACTAHKLKYTSSEAIRTAQNVYSDSSLTRYHVNRSARSGQSAYDAVWWLKGNVHVRPDSSLSADEAWIQLKGQQTSREQRVDSAQYRLQHTAAQQQLAQEQVNQTQKAKKSRTALPWWLYGLLMAVMGLLFFRFFPK